MIGAIQNALSGLLASSKRVEASAANIANAHTEGALDAADGRPPYSAVTTVQEGLTDNNGGGAGVRSEIVSKNPPFVPAYNPGSPFANADGAVGLPNVNFAEEAVHLNIAETTFRANLKVLETVSELQEDVLRIFDDEV